MNYTSNYNLKKPSGSDKVNVSDFNNNFDTIDGILKTHEELQNNQGGSSFPTQIKDFVTETGTINSWKYEKWDSGKVVCQRYYQPGSQTFYSTDTVFDYSSFNIVLPNLFATTPYGVTITPVMDSDTYGFITVKGLSSTILQWETYAYNSETTSKEYLTAYFIELVGDFMVG